MSRFDEHELDRIRSETDWPRLLAKRDIEARRVGANFVALCPFHSEKTPSCTFYGNGRFHCFGCLEGGDVFDFVQKFDNVDFVEAGRRLEAHETHGPPNGTPRKVSAPSGPPQPPEWINGRDLENAVESIWELQRRPQALGSMARRRGWKVEVLEQLRDDFELGLLGDKWVFLTPWGCKLRWSEGEERKFSMRGPQGLWRVQDPRGASVNCDRLRDADKVLVCEGETDCIAALCSGAWDDWLVIGSPGTGFPPWAPPLFGGKHVLLSFDSETSGAGRKGAERAAGLLRPYVRCVQVREPLTVRPQ